MAIKRNFGQQVIDDYINNFVETRVQRIILELQRVGETCVGIARTNHKYKDQTGNLTSSIGYLIAVDGIVHTMSSFEAVSATGGEGSTKGKDFIQEILRKYRKGIVFIMVAGMPYATYVNAMGLDVFDSAEINANKMIDEITTKLKLR